MEDDAAQYLRVNKGWTVAEIGRDPSWRPIATVGVPHVAVGSGWVVAFEPRRQMPTRTRAKVVGGDRLDRGLRHAGQDLLHDDRNRFVAFALLNSLQVVDDHRFSFLFADGPLDDERSPTSCGDGLAVSPVAAATEPISVVVVEPSRTQAKIIRRCLDATETSMVEMFATGVKALRVCELIERTSLSRRCISKT